MSPGDVLSNAYTVSVAVGKAIKTLSTLISDTVSAFQVSCSKTGYKRENTINIKNAGNKTLYLLGTYEDSGKLYDNGSYYIHPNDPTSVWKFVKHSGSATGSTGVMVF